MCRFEIELQWARTIGFTCIPLGSADNLGSMLLLFSTPCRMADPSATKLSVNRRTTEMDAKYSPLERAHQPGSVGLTELI